MNNIFNLFGPSPIKPIEQHMHKAYHCAKQLYSLFEAALAENWDLAQQIRIQIITLEQEADLMKRDLRLHLPTGLFLPVARTDLLELLSAQDKIANKAKDIAGLMIGRKLKIPDSLAPLILPFINRTLDAAKLACRAINELDELLESGFRGTEVKIVEDMIVNLDEIEHDCDEKLDNIRHHIFNLESSKTALDIIFLYQLVQWIGDLADEAQTVGARLQILIAR